MIDTLQNQDTILELNEITAKDIIESITLEDVKTFLESLGVEQIAMYPEKGHLICPTICHNPLDEAESMKLYWYQNNKIFRCYTECNEAMSIFSLYQKFMDINYNQKVDFYEAEEYVKKCLKHIILSSSSKRKSTLALEAAKYAYDARLPLLDEYSNKVLECFIDYCHPQWLRDGITPESMKKFNIKFSVGQNKIIIPHLDIEGRLVGIRGRTIDPEEAEMFGKYRPIQIGQTLYAHPLQFNLYGLYEHQEGIEARKSAIIVEGEKSVLLDDGYYGDLSNAVACCGSTFNKYHINLLTNYLGVEEITIAFDKEYTDWRTEKAKKYRHKIESACRKYTNLASFSYIWDYDNLLEEKDSPFDKGKEVFEELYRNRIKVR